MIKFVMKIVLTIVNPNVTALFICSAFHYIDLLLFFISPVRR